MFQILQDEKTRGIYDRFGRVQLSSKRGDIEGQEQEYYQLAMGEGVILYLVYLIFVLLLTYESSLRLCRYILVVTTCLFWGLEFQALNTKVSRKDLFDLYSPDYALYQRIAFGRLACGVVACLTRSAFKTFQDSMLSSILHKMDCIIMNQKQIGNSMSFDESSVRTQMEKNLAEINKLSANILSKIQGELQSRKEARRSSRCYKLIQLAVVGFCIVAAVRYFDLVEIVTK